ncbi:HlyD family efflux transporter periplasmic adaptor subunit [Sphingomonas sp.]|uniref:HlyD family secretion protein n=1 Tax=Sphingomonas sp. TaxID=28214 RepID=UPI0028A9AB33|nr:HlyD family efflux transporter periplasmic adaptor subunit [Sphingomonas sp.]
MKKTAPGTGVAYHMQSPVLLAQPLLERVLTLFFGATFVVAIVFCALTQYSRTTAARGEVAAASGFSALVAEHSGVIAAILVRPGQQVAKGQALARLTRPQIVVAGGDATQLSIQQSKAMLRNIDLQLSDNARSIAAIQAQIAQIRRGATISTTAAGARRGLTEQRKQVAQKRLGGLETLASEGLVTQMAVDQARVQSMQLLQEVADADMTINEIARGRDERVGALDSRSRELYQAAMTLRTQRLQIEQQLVSLQVGEEQTIVAPEAGIVAAVNMRAGGRVEEGQRIFAIARPDAKLTAVLQVPSRAIGLIERGQRVSLKYDAFPFQTYGLHYGRVTRVEAASLEGERPATDEQEVDRRFLVEIQPDDLFIKAYGRPRPLRVGMMLTADIEVERRSILAWWLAPLLSIAGRLT